jgi:hypothetical protein
MPYSVSPARTSALASPGIAIGAGGGRTGAGRVAREAGRAPVEAAVRDDAG